MATISFNMKNNSKELKEVAEEQIDKALELCGMQAEGYAKMLCPVDTGFLRNSITHAISGQPTAISEYSDNDDEEWGEYDVDPMPEDETKNVYIGSNVVYAPSVEMGSIRNTPQPYLKPAISDHTDEYRQIIEKALKGEL